MDNRITMLNQIFNKLDSENDISSFGKVIEFYIATGYDKLLTIEEIEDELERYADSHPTRANFDNYFDNVITNGYFTHSFNGYALEHYKKWNWCKI